MKKICILDYGLGNIRSLFNAIKKIGFNPTFFSERKNNNFDIVFIPGVGSFLAASKLVSSPDIQSFLNDVKSNQNIIFGICLGMQVMLTRGEEHGISNGLNLISGNVTKLPANMILPHVGWAKVKFDDQKISFLKEYNNEKFYHIHSYIVNLDDKNCLLSKTKYGNVEFISAINKKNYYGTQFHPEKSGDIGLDFLQRFVNFF
jgi:glutamine amidotransferase|tara:strand:+ start:1581 stop:2189 length:609 start_codon:yes stop_codon:yes gene_type:complete